MTRPAHPNWPQSGVDAIHLRAQALALRAGGLAQTRHLFTGLDFELRAGERWVVLGPNGAGKSTLLAALAHVLPLAEGALSLQGKPLAAWPRAALADWRAWCPQFWADPFAATVRDTVLLARHRAGWWPAGGRSLATEIHHSDGNHDDHDDALLQQVLHQLDLGPLAQADVRTLSGGERQRVAVATAVMQGAPLLLLDEPASHLDLAHQQQLLALLLAHANTGGALVCSLHDLNLAWDLASHAIVLDGRGGVRAGPRDEVMTPAHLSAVFGVAIVPVEVCGERRFWVGPASARGS